MVAADFVRECTRIGRDGSINSSSGGRGRSRRRIQVREQVEGAARREGSIRPNYLCLISQAQEHTGNER